MPEIPHAYYRNTKFIAILGATSSGKSEFIHLLRDSNYNDDADRTKSIARLRLKYGEISYILFDTPTFNTTNLKDKDVLEMLQITMSSSGKSEQAFTLDGILWMYRTKSYTKGGKLAVSNFEILQALCGTNDLHKVIVVVTSEGNDRPNGDDFQIVQGLLKPATDRKARVVAHDGSLASAQQVLDMLFPHPDADGEYDDPGRPSGLARPSESSSDDELGDRNLGNSSHKSLVDDETMKQIEKHKRSVDALITKLNEQTSRILELEAELLKCDAEKTVVVGSLRRAIEEEKEALVKEREKLDDEREDVILRRQVVDAEKRLWLRMQDEERGILEREKAEITSERLRLEGEREGLILERYAIEAEKRALSQLGGKLESEKHAREQEKEELERKRGVLEEEREMLKGRESDGLKEKERLDGDRKEFLLGREKLEAERKSWGTTQEEDKQALVQEKEAVAKARHDLEEEQDQLRLQREELEGEKKRLLDNIQGTNTTRTLDPNLQQQIDELRSKNTSLEETVVNLKSELESRKLEQTRVEEELESYRHHPTNLSEKKVVSSVKVEKSPWFKRWCCRDSAVLDS
ncbi:hypothetical protein C8Q75DRAFT_806413 [Abortiporus biennis]|nr:hypothetical protein C8Q75DRAFT_806413 [Abortiporus biennis]